MKKFLEETLAQLEALGSERMREQNRKRGCGDKQFGVLHGDIRKIGGRVTAAHSSRELSFPGP